MLGNAPGTPLTRIARPSFRRSRRLWRFLGTAMLATGLVMLLVGVTVFLTQGSQIQVTATVISEHCHPQYDLGTGSTDTRCGAAIRYTTRTGQVIAATITDAFPGEFRHTAAGMTTIQVRYDSGDPASPYKQSNYMPLGQFLLVLGLGCAATVAGGWWLARADLIARRAAARRSVL